MEVWGLDPGYEESALVVFDGDTVLRHDIQPNAVIRSWLRAEADLAIRAGRLTQTYLAIERLESMGMAVGKEVFETVDWAGRFREAWFPCRVARITRHEVKLHLCGARNVKDTNVRQAIIDRFGVTKERAIGTKKAPGPLHGLVGHEYAALAVALTWWDRYRPNQAGTPATAPATRQGGVSHGGMAD